MIADVLAAETAEGRIAERSNVFVTATLYTDVGSAPVRIRNLSATGALIEGSVLPPQGARVRLSRGSLHVSGEMMWSAGGRAGLQFAGSISVPDWFPRASSGRSQQHVDEIVFTAKSGRTPAMEPAPAASPMPGDLQLELARLASGLNRLCEQLADDPHIAAYFPGNLQIIEATANRLDRLAKAALTP